MVQYQCLCNVWRWTIFIGFAFMNLVKVDLLGNHLLNCLSFSKHFPDYFSVVLSNSHIDKILICYSVRIRICCFLFWLHGSWEATAKFSFDFIKFKFKLFLNDLWYEPETLWLFLTFTRDYFAEKKLKKNFRR